MARTRTSLRLGAVASAALVAGMLPLATLGGQAQALEQDGKNIFVVGVLQDVDNLNPFKGITVMAYESWALAYDSLTGYGAESFQPVPRLAESWESSEDGLTWDRVSHDEAVFGGPGYSVMRGVTAGGPGLVAVGSLDVDGDGDAVVWLSADGLTWHRVPHDEAVFGGSGNQGMDLLVVAAGGKLIACGWGDDTQRACWVSPPPE